MNIVIILSSDIYVRFISDTQSQMLYGDQVEVQHCYVLVFALMCHAKFHYGSSFFKSVICNQIPFQVSQCKHQRPFYNHSMCDVDTVSIFSCPSFCAANECTKQHVFGLSPL